MAPSSKPTYRVFLSAVTRELGTYRIEVARVLRRKGLEVRDQEHFHQGPATLLEQLRDYIEHCDAVILLIGERCGEFPTEEHAAALEPILPFESYRRSPGRGRASYTQWELFLAKHYGKKTYVFLSSPGFKPDEANPEDADLQACQVAYREWMINSGEHWDSLTTRERLIEDVLVLPFPDLPALTPVALPYSSLGPLFQGRDEMLARLHQALERSPTGRATAIAGKAVHGLGGVGKTRLAVEYAWKHAEEYSALLFVGAGSPADLRRNLAVLSGSLILDLPEKEVAEEEVREVAVLKWLQEHSGWLLILDNVDTEDAAAAVDALIPLLHGGHLLLTGRLARWSAEVEAIELDVLTEEAAIRFLLSRTNGRRRATKEDERLAAKLASELGCLPLALEQASAYIAERRLTLAGYLDEWTSRRDQVLRWFDPRVSHYPASVAITWQTSFDRLSAPARRLLERLAWLGPEPIPESLLDVPIPDLEELEVDPRGGLVQLETYSLVTRAAEAPTFTVHRLVQDVTRRSLKDHSPQESLIEALRWVNAAFKGDPQDVRTWSTLDPLGPHAQAVVAFADNAGVAEPTARLMNQLGTLQLTKALLAEAEPLLRRALAIDEQSFGATHPNVARDLSNLAVLLQAANQLGEAEPLMRRALAIDEQGFGATHPKVAIRLNNLAQLLQDTNRFAEAEPLMERVVMIFESRLGEQHPNVAAALNNLALLLQDTNRLAEAEPLMRRALAIDEQSFGATHPNVAIRLSNLAALLQATNRLGEAEPLMRQALAIDEQSFGATHPNVAIDLNNLAGLLRATNRLGEAEPLMRRALAIDEQSFGATHPNVARHLNNLARLLQDTNRLGEAEPLMRRALAIVLEFEQRNGYKHPNQAKASKNYEAMLRELGRSDAEIEAAMRLLKQEAGLRPLI
jgi:tetratricopeptide (TPR) repeat protein